SPSEAEVTSRTPELDLPSVEGPETLLRETGSVWRIALRRFLRRKIGVTGLVLVGFMILLALLAPVIAPYSPYQDFIGEPDAVRWASPCVNVLGCEGQQHLFGLDGNVRDLFSRVLHGARVSLPLGFTTVLVAIVIGAMIGSVAGYVGGWVDNV